MSEAFDWLEANLNDPETIETPDEAIDYISMIGDDEWPLLLQLWDERSVHWREGLAYLVSFRSAKIALPFLRKAIFDENADVCVQGLLSLSDLGTRTARRFNFRPPNWSRHGKSANWRKRGKSAISRNFLRRFNSVKQDASAPN